MELIVETSVFNDERLSDDVREVQQVASTAIDIADNNSQYFWCTEVGTDTGVHITLTPQDTFKANPSGYNLLARNNGVEVRDGLTACSVFTNGGAYFNAMLNGTNQLVAKYEASGAQIGAELSGYRNITIDNTNGIRFRNGTVNLAHYNIGSVVFYDGDTTTNHELMNLGITGMTLKNNSGYKTFYVGNNGLIIYDGDNDSHDLLNLNTSGLTLKGIFDSTLSNCAVYGADGLIVYGYTDSTTRGEIAKIYSGVGNSQTSGVTKYAPYYTFGTRMDNMEIGNYSCVIGMSGAAVGHGSYAEGGGSLASGMVSHAEGELTEAHGNYSHAEGNQTVAYGNYSHAEGAGNQDGLGEAYGAYSHSECYCTLAYGSCSHSEGSVTEARGNYSHAGGSYSISGGNYAFAHGDHAYTQYDYQVAIGRYNSNKSTSLFEIGYGVAGARANVFDVSTDGVVDCSGGYTKSGYTYITTVNKTATNNIIYGEDDTSHAHYESITIDATQTGYTLIGVMSYNIFNSSSGGSGSTHCTVFGMTFSDDTVTVKVRNRANSNAKVDVSVRCLYRAT